MMDWPSNTSIREPIFWAINLFTYEMNLPYPFLNIFSGAVFFFGTHILAKRQPDPLSFLVLMFPILIINIPMSGIRQGAAIGIYCIALSSFIDQKPLKFLFWILIATCFHSSSIIFILLLPFSSGRLNNKRILIAILLFMPFAIIIYYFGSAKSAIDSYVGTDEKAYGAIFRVGLLSLTALYFFIFVKNKWKKKFPYDYNIVSLGAIAMITLFFLLPLSSVIFDRFGYFLIPIQAMIFSRLPFLPFYKYHLFHSILPYVCLLIIFITWTNISWHFEECYLPYQNWIFGFPSGEFFRLN